MPKLYTINNTLVSINGYYLGQFDRYDVTVAPSEHGSVVATPTRGLIGTTITLSSTPDDGYELDYYTVNGVAIVGNTFTLTGNTTVAAVFKVYAVYDSYVIHLTWPSPNSFGMAGLHIDDVQPSVSDVTMKYYYEGWQEIYSSDVAYAINWNDSYGCTFAGTAVDINFTANIVPSKVQVRTNGVSPLFGDYTLTMRVAGIKAGVETDLGQISQTYTKNKIYTVNIS